MATKTTQQEQDNGKPEIEKRPEYHVYDLNQRGKEPRKHEIITKTAKTVDGRIEVLDFVSYELYSGKPCKMPMEHALKLLCDPAFKVLGPSGTRIEPISKHDASKPITVLADDQIVVKHDELSREALLRRVKVLPGSENVSMDASDQELADFLTAWNRSKKGMTDGERALAEKIASGDLTADQMTPAMSEKMFPRSQMLDRQAA